MAQLVLLLLVKCETLHAAVYARNSTVLIQQLVLEPSDSLPAGWQQACKAVKS